MVLAPKLGAHAGAIAHVAVGQREEVIVIGLVGESAEEELAEVAPSVAREIHGEEGHVQRGVSDPAYPGGRMCYRFEEPLHRYQNMIVDRMVGIRRVPAGDAVEQAPMFR